MIVKISNEKIWWDDNSDNKPNNSYFTSFKNSMQSSNININMKSYGIIETVISQPNITYIWINQNGFNYYYYYNRILKVMEGAYLVEYAIDTFTTFTLPYMEYLRTSNTNVKLNRHIKYNIEGLQYEDDLLEAIPKIINVKKWRTSRTSKWVNQNYSSGTIKRQSRINLWNGYVFINNMEYGLTTPNIYVAVDWNEQIHLIPCFATHPYIEGAINNYMGIHFPESNKPEWYISTSDNGFVSASGGRDSYLPLENLDIQGIVNILTNGGKSNKIIGVFTGPPIYELNRDNTRIIYSTHTSTKKVSNLLSIAIDSTRGINTLSNDGVYRLGDIPEGLSLEAPNALNNSTLSIYASNQINLKINGRDFKLFTLLRNDKERNKMYLGSYAVFNFTSSGFISVRSDYYGMNALNLIFTEDLPVVLSKYQQYIEATKNTRDTGINVAKQNLNIGLFQNAASGLWNAGVAYKNLNFANFTTGVASTIMSGYNQVIGYNQKLAMIRADLADKKASFKNTVESGSVEDASLATYIKVNVDKVQGGAKNDLWTGDFIEWTEYNQDTIKAMNNVLYLYGQFNPKINNLNYFTDNNRKFNYYKFDSEYLTNIFATTLRGENGVPIQREYYNTIADALTAGVRLWKEKPQW